MRIKIFFGLLVLFGVFLSSPNILSSQSRYGECFDVSQVSNISDFSQKIDRVRSAGVFVFVENYVVLRDKNDPYSGPETELMTPNTGKGMIIVDNDGDKHIVSAQHIFNFEPEFVFQITKGRSTPREREQLENKFIVRSYQRIFVSRSGARNDTEEAEFERTIQFEQSIYGTNENTDIAILRVPDGFENIKPIRLIRSDACLGEKTTNTLVWIVGGSFLSYDPNDTWSFPGVDLLISEVANNGVGRILFRIRNDIFSSSSGSGVVAYHNGEFKLVGIVEGSHYINQGNANIPIDGLVYKIDPLIDFFINN